MAKNNKAWSLESKSRAIEEFIGYVRDNYPEETETLMFMVNSHKHWLKEQKNKIDPEDTNTMSLFA